MNENPHNTPVQNNRGRTPSEKGGKETMGRIVISKAYQQDTNRIELISVGNDIANAYFRLIGRPRPVGVKFEKVQADDPLYKTAFHAELHIGRKLFLAAYAEKMNLMVYAERYSGVENE